MKKQLFADLPSWLTDNIPCDNLMVAFIRQLRNGVWSKAITNRAPTNYIWENITGLEGFGNNMFVAYKGMIPVKIERTDQGIHWRVTIGDGLNAIVLGLIEGDPAHDLCSCNPAVEMIPLDNMSSVALQNETTFNGVRWDQADITAVQHANFHHSVTGVKDGEWGATQYIANDNLHDWNRASGGRPEGAIITFGDAREVIQDDDDRDLNQMIADGKADYSILPADMLDADRERYVLTPVTAFKNYERPLTVFFDEMPFKFNTTPTK